MKLLELLPVLKKYGRIRREYWNEEKFLVRPIDDCRPLVFCNMGSLIIENFLVTFEDLISDDWELID